MITDGLPTADETFPISITDTGVTGVVDDVAAIVANEDLSASLDGEQLMEVYTIGFGVSDPILQATAEKDAAKLQAEWQAAMAKTNERLDQMQAELKQSLQRAQKEEGAAA